MIVYHLKLGTVSCATHINSYLHGTDSSTDYYCLTFGQQHTLCYVPGVVLSVRVMQIPAFLTVSHYFPKELTF